MERLTARDEKGRAYSIWVGYLKIVEKLADLEDAEEQGLLLRLPCAIGTTVYVIEEEYLDMYEPSSKYCFVAEEKFNVYMLEIFGEDVFLTREEAEAKLVEIQKGK